MLFTVDTFKQNFFKIQIACFIIPQFFAVDFHEKNPPNSIACFIIHRASYERYYPGLDFGQISIWKWKEYFTHECTTNISFLVFRHLVIRPTCSLKPEFYTAAKEISSSFQKCIGICTLYAAVLRNLTSNWPSTIDVNDDQWRHLFTTPIVDVMTSDWYI